MDLDVVLVEPKFGGNIGSVARVMKNFGFSDLFLVNPTEIGEEARAMASNAQNILDNVVEVDSVEELLVQFDYRVATTGIRGETSDRHIRMPYFTPRELKDKLRDKIGKIGLFFGREDYGLPNKVLKECEIIVSIPTSDEYPIMNLAQSVAILMYELSEIEKEEIRLASQKELDIIYERLSKLVNHIDYPEHKREKTNLMLKRIFGRSELTAREAHTLAGWLKALIEEKS
ncbi:MAG: tRNA C32U32 (ribose-2'-O)-methylase TrmJ [Candidatus Methanohalarchaeum thermophilum]|uniref:tRNA C32U32 (Ribose-2'-O)-methylase TrmJ n=1 Tax=Methanohalarchaeum thermophilum TaxID=1903181 RepID=A0A1Q6DXY2_METT1|nr:MAG: tRNA C32U32 (ribose-2'-O)-methylase TrmJ [Candidatus Methanohalarchaeum thermophilum]